MILLHCLTIIKFIFIHKDWKTIKNDSALFKQGYLYKGPDGGGGASERMFANLAGSKSFKRRYCILK